MKLSLAIAALLLATISLHAIAQPPPAGSAPASAPAPTRKMIADQVLSASDGPAARILRRPDLPAEFRATIQKILDAHQELGKKVGACPV